MRFRDGNGLAMNLVIKKVRYRTDKEKLLFYEAQPVPYKTGAFFVERPINFTIPLLNDFQAADDFGWYILYSYIPEIANFPIAASTTFSMISFIFSKLSFSVRIPQRSFRL